MGAVTTADGMAVAVRAAMPLALPRQASNYSNTSWSNPGGEALRTKRRAGYRKGRERNVRLAQH